MKKVSEVSKLAGISIRTLQYYDYNGMLPVPPEITIGEMSYMEYLSEFRKTLFQ